MKVSAKLVNWHRMIKDTLPAFFLILEFGRGDRPRSAYLVPIDETRMSYALRRIRELDAKGESLSRRTLAVIFGDDERLERPSAKAFESAVRKHIGPNLEAYQSKKRSWANSVGYENNRGSFTVNFTVDTHAASHIEPLVDLSLGLVESLPINYAEFHDHRFDIPARVPMRFPDGLLFVVERPSRLVETVFSHGASVVRTTMEMFLPHGLANVLDSAHFKLRLKSLFFEIVISRLSSSFRFELPGIDDKVSLGKLVDFARVLLLFGEAVRKKEEIILTLQAEEALLFQNTMAPSECINPRLRELAETMLDAWAIAKLMDIQDRVELTISDLMLQRVRLKAVRNLGENIGRVRLRGFIPKGSVSEGERVKMPYGIEVVLGDYRGVVVTSLWGNIKFTGLEDEGADEFEMESSERRLESALAAKMNQEPQVSLGAAVRAIFEAPSSVPCLLLSDFAAPDSGTPGKT